MKSNNPILWVAVIAITLYLAIYVMIDSKQMSLLNNRIEKLEELGELQGILNGKEVESYEKQLEINQNQIEVNTFLHKQIQECGDNKFI